MPPRSGRGFNRLAVEAALRRAVALWARLSQAAYPNGAVIFCSETLAEVVHPLQALTRRVYSCGRHFDTSALRRQLMAERTQAYGLIVIDGSEACIGTAKGLGLGSDESACAVSVVARISSTAASRTRRGGQSALRYSRLREEADLAFIRRVAERATDALQGVKAVALAGKGDARHRLQAELPQPLRSRLLCSVALPCDAGPGALRLAAARVAATAASAAHGEAEQVLARFMDLVKMPTEASEVLAVYGQAQTLVALRLGAVETLFVPSGDEAQTLRGAAALQGTKVVEVSDSSEMGSEFVECFGVGGCLRWPVDPELLEEEAEKEEDKEVLEEQTEEQGADASSTCACTGEVKVAEAVLEEQTDEQGADASSTCACTGEVKVAEAVPRRQTEEESEGLTGPASDHHDNPSRWLCTSLYEDSGDAASAEALVMCVEVLLGGPSCSDDELLVQAVDLLIGEGAPEAIATEWARRARKA